MFHENFYSNQIAPFNIIASPINMKSNAIPTKWGLWEIPAVGPTSEPSKWQADKMSWYMHKTSKCMSCFNTQKLVFIFAFTESHHQLSGAESTPLGLLAYYCHTSVPIFL